MDPNFWHRKWERNDIGFHEHRPNPLLIQYFPQLCLAKGSRIFLPLCGKTLDIAWLLANGYAVAGAELSPLAVDQLFQALALTPNIFEDQGLTIYSANNIDIFVGDILALSGHKLGKVDAIYDRAALVALPPEMRNKYAAHLIAITAEAPQLIICYDYDISLMQGHLFL